MTESMPRQPDESESDFFEHHEWGLKNHAWAHIQNEVLSLNKEELSAEELRAHLPGLNMKLYSIKHFDAYVEVSGKLRDVHAREGNVMTSAPASANLLPTETDKDGQFRTVYGEKLIFRYFAVYTPDGIIGEDGSGEMFDEDDKFADTDRRPEIVMTLSDPDEGYTEQGPLYMFPEENEQAVFEEDVSMENQQYLDYYHSEVIDQIDKAFDPDENGEVDIVAGLQGIFFQDLDHEAKKRAEKYMFSRLGIDYLVSVDVDGYVGSISTGGEIVEAHYSGELSPFTATGVWLVDGEVDGETGYRPSLAGAIADPESNTGFQARIVPADSLREVESLRPRHREFGEVALKNFDDPYQVYDFLKNEDSDLYTEGGTGGLDESGEDVITPEDQKAFHEIVKEISKDSQDMTELSRLRRLIDREGRGYYAEDATKWLSKLRLSFNRHLESVRVPGGMNEDALNDVVRLVEKDMVKYDNVLKGEVLQTRGACYVIDARTGGLMSVEKNHMVRGEFTGLVPLQHSHDGQAGESLGMLFDSAVMASDGGRLEDVFENGMCVVVVDESSKVERVVYQEDDQAN